MPLNLYPYIPLYPILSGLLAIKIPLKFRLIS